MNEPYPTGTTVELLCNGKIYAVAKVTHSEKIGKRERARYRASLGDYKYYLVGEHFGVWQHSCDLRVVET